MPLDLTSFPVVPPQRNALNSADVRSYITNPAWSNFIKLESLVEALETALNAVPVTTRDSSMPDSASLLDRWIDPSSNSQEKICVVAYTSGNGQAAYWESLRDSAATTLAKTVANAQSPDAGHLSSLKSDITAMAADSSLSGDEISILNTLVSEIQSRNSEIISSATAYGINGGSAYTNYINSYNTWTNLPPVPSNPLPVNFTTVWHDLLDKESAILSSIRSAGQTLLQTLNGDVNALQNTVDDMAADNKITPQEKLLLKREYERIKNEYSKLTALATSLGHTGSSEYTTYQATYSTWLTLIDTTLNVFGDMGATTTITDVSAWNTTWDNYYLDAKVFDNYVDTQFKSSLDSFSTNLTTIQNSVNGLASDGIINGGSEKRLLRQYWQEIQTQDTIIRSQASTFGVSLPSAYTSSYTSLDTYLNTTLGVFANMETDTAVNRADMENFFSSYRTQYGLLAASVATAQANSIQTSEPANYSEFTDTIDSIASDGIISAGAEKQRVNALWADIQATHASFIAQATEAGVSTSNLQNRYNELEAYLTTLTHPNGTTPNFTITNQDTAIGSTAFYQYFRNYEAAKGTTNESIISSMLSTVRESVQTVADMNNDGTITPIEKTTLKRIWDKYTVERDNAVTQADTLSITTEKDAMTTSYTNLQTYLNSLDGGAGVFTNMGTATILTTQENNDWDVKWFDFETKLQALLTAIQSKQISTTLNVAADAFKHDGSQPATGTFDLNNFKIANLLAGSITSGSKDAINGDQLYTEQQARTTAISNAQNALQANIDQEVTDRTNADAAEVTARDNAISAHSALTTGAHGVGAGSIVGTDLTQTLTNKTIDASLNTLSNIGFSALTGVKTSLTPADHTSLATSLAIKNYGDANWGGGGGGGGGAVDLEWVAVGNAETVNTGINAIVAEGTLVLPAGKKWKWVKIVFSHHSAQSSSSKVNNINRIDVDLNNDTSNFVISTFDDTDTAGTSDNAYPTHIAEGAPSIVDQDITIKMYAADTGALSNRSAYIVGIAAGDPFAGAEEYGVYGVTSPTTQPAISPLLGTRIDVTDPLYSDCSFSMKLDMTYIDSDTSMTTSSGEQSGYHAKIYGLIKKVSGGEPFVHITYEGHDTNTQINRVSILYGTLSVGGATLTSDTMIDSLWETFSIERVESSSELCFRLTLNGRFNYSGSLKSAFHGYLSGPKTYLGTPISSSNGTEF